MKKFALTLVLLAALAAPALSGDIPGSGKSDPPPIATPTPTTSTSTPTTEPADDTSALEDALLKILLTLLGA